MILFDFDGTLANSLEAAFQAYNRIAPEYGTVKMEDEDRKLLSGGNPKDLLKKYGISPQKLGTLMLRIRKELRHCIAELKPVPGMETVMQALYQEGHSLGIVTSNARENVLLFLKNNQLEEYFQLVYTGKSLFGKDKVFKRLFKQKGLSPKEVLYVGDETRDIEACKKTGIPIIAVSWGINNRKTLSALEPEGLADSPEEIPGLIRKINKNRE
jgi:phosphoglycolate phosphatase